MKTAVEILFYPISLLFLLAAIAWGFLAIYYSLPGVIILAVASRAIAKFKSYWPMKFKFCFIISIFLLLNLIPLPRPGRGFGAELHEYTEPWAIGIGWPYSIAKYFLGEGDLCQVCVVKDPVHSGSVRMMGGGFLYNGIELLLLSPPLLAALVFFTRRTKDVSVKEVIT